MQLAYTMASGRGETDLLLLAVCQHLAKEGVKICGTAQINTDRIHGAACDMDVRVLPDGPDLRISQNLGHGSRGCRLDHGALEQAVGLVTLRLQTGADFLIVNKFGKHEAEGRGFRTVIADAVAHDIPVLVGANTLNVDDFLRFVGPGAVSLTPSNATILDWCYSALETKRVAA
jgi:nucleoside-triphosphatase THEP1